MKSSKRGGTRKCAGRPTDLSPGQWVKFGYAIENEITRQVNAMHQAAVMAEVKALEPQLPHNWRKLWSRRELTDDVELIKFDNQEDMKMIVQALSVSKNRATPPTGLYAFAPKKALAGITEPIIKCVARKLSRQWKVPISLRTAQRCWRDHKKHMAWLRKGGEDDYIPKPDMDTESGDV